MTDQKTKTKEYWDNFYRELPSADDANRFATDGATSTSANVAHANAENGPSDLEWIVPNSPKLLDTILSLFPKSIDPETSNDAPKRIDDSTEINVLEIGCGVSQLSHSLLQRLLLTSQNTIHNHVSKRPYNFVSTDFSPVCIGQNRKRDAVFISSVNAADGSLKYDILDVIKGESSSPHIQRYDVILDKGTLDTFLFRSKRTKKGSSYHPPLLTPLLNNIHCWLRGGCGAKYIIISPRSKIKSVRDFRGFESVRRSMVDISKLDSDVVLVKGNSEKRALSKSEVYLYECVRNDSYNPEEDAPYHSLECIPEDESSCTHCNMSFKEFRGSVEVRDQGEIVWARRWKNHCVHCKSIEK